tara:strand:+ start:1750 stop:2454 length:705 start_codon:yes stop_codon:yes gene_type:complete
MGKKFDIHEWQAKIRLAEQEEFTPNLEDDELKRGAIQQMMDKEKTDRTLDYKGGAILGPKIAMLLPEDYSIKNFARDVGGVIEVEYGKHNIKTFLDELEDYFSIYSNDERSLGEEMDEQNVTGTGASFSAGNSPAYATPKAFGKKKDKDIEVLGYKKVNEGHGLETDDLEQLKTYTNNLPEDTLSDKAIKRILNFLIKSNIKVDKTKDLSKEKNELKVPHRKSGYMGYSEPVKK